jgi:hypothetical protein
LLVAGSKRNIINQNKSKKIKKKFWKSYLGKCLGEQETSIQQPLSLDETHV